MAYGAVPSGKGILQVLIATYAPVVAENSDISAFGLLPNSTFISSNDSGPDDGSVIS